MEERHPLARAVRVVLQRRKRGDVLRFGSTSDPAGSHGLAERDRRRGVPAELRSGDSQERSLPILNGVPSRGCTLNLTALLAVAA